MNPANRFDWKTAWQEFREWLATIPSATQTTTRHCPDCHDELDLICGSRTNQFWYVHRNLSDCFYVGWRNRIKFDTKEQAEETAQVFK